MNGRNNFVFSLDGEQKSFYFKQMQVPQFCRLIRSVFQTDKSITALMDAQGNVCELQYFCEHLNSLHDKFYIILTDNKKNKRQKQKHHHQIDSRNGISKSHILLNSSVDEDANLQILDFNLFLQDMQTIRYNPNQPMQTIVLIFDNDGAANLFGSAIVHRVIKQYPQMQAYYTVVMDEDETDTLLLAIFDNQFLRREVEIQLNHNLAEEVCRQIEFQEDDEEVQQYSRVATPQEQSAHIPLIVTRGDQRQVLQVEPNDNFHSRQGKRPHGVMRITKAVQQIKHRLENKEYEYILGLIVNSDTQILAAYQQYQRQQNEALFVQSLKALVPDENNLSFNKDAFNMKIMTSPGRSVNMQQSINYPYASNDSNPVTPVLRSPAMILDALLQTKDLDQIEMGMLRTMQMDSDALDLVKSMQEHPNEVILSVLIAYAKEKFTSIINANFTSEHWQLIMADKTNKLSPIYAGFQDFSQVGNLEELIELLKENVEQYTTQRAPELCYSYYLVSKNTNNFQLKISGPAESESEDDGAVSRRKSIDLYQMQTQKEQYFIDKFHVKVLEKYSNEDYSKLFKMVIESCNYFDEADKNKLIDFYNQGNQRLLEILDKYGQRYDIQAIKQDLSDLVMLQDQRYDNISSPTNSTIVEPKMQKLKNFKFLINYFYEIDKVFTLRQVKTFFYLYCTEDISILAAYEVYCETKDQEEFIQTLIQIYQIKFLQEVVDVEEIEAFDELIEQQLNILFAYRRFLNLEQRSALDKNLRAGDNSLLKLFRDFLRSKNQKLFIQQLQAFADQKCEQLRNIETDLMNKRVKRDELKLYQKDIISRLHAQFMKSKLKYPDMLLDAVDKDNIIIRSAFEVYDQTLDKQDFVENLLLAYQHIYKLNVRSILKALIIELQRSKTDLTLLLKKLDQDDAIMKGAFELYFQNRDESELKDTISRILRFIA